MIIIAIGVLVLGVICFDLYSRSRPIRHSLRAFRQRMPGFAYGGIFTHYWVKGSVSGLPVSITVTQGGNRSHPKLTVACYKKTPCNFVVLRGESQPDFFLRSSHQPVLCSQIRTNDRDFDARFAVYSHNNADVAGYFYNTERKNVVYAIFDRGYTLLEFRSRGVFGQKFDYTGGDVQPEMLKTILENVVFLAQGA